MYANVEKHKLFYISAIRLKLSFYGSNCTRLTNYCHKTTGVAHNAQHVMFTQQFSVAVKAATR